LQSYARSFTEYANYTVPELIAIAYAYRFDLDEDGQDFVEKLHAWGAIYLKRRQIKWLAGICRHFESVGHLHARRSCLAAEAFSLTAAKVGTALVGGAPEEIRTPTRQDS
jgi:hypothetical protein